ncbi:MAG: glycosyltransferase family 4 protein [Anaerolineales bacterium]|nr:glycosyltransferase family 4 protein [Anaerolineales bacterium]
MPRMRNPQNLLMAWNILKRIDQLSPDIVHVSFWTFWAMPVFGLFLKTPLVVSVHDVERHVGERGLWAVPSFVYPWQWLWSDHVIVHADSAKQRLVGQYNYQPGRIHVIPIGSYEYYHRFTHGDCPERPNTVLFFGRIWGYKGLQYLIEAEPLITQAVPNARIIIAGQGESFEKYRQTMINPDHFEIHNYHIPDEMITQLFQSASIVVLPHIEVTQTGIIGLAYAFGKPVVATTVGGIPDMVDDGVTGLLVPPRDPESLAKAIITLLKNREMRLEMGRRALQKAETELSWSEIAQQTLRIYEAVLATT